MRERNTRVLVADDEEAIRGALSILLEEDGYDVTAVASAEEALERFGSDPFPLVITDIRMGGMSGIDLLKEVKRLHPDTEVIVITSYASLETAMLALRSGAYDYLLKPFEDLELVTTAVARAADKECLVREKKRLLEALAQKNEELLAVNRILAERANRDGLTGLYNHRYFQEALRHETARSVRHGHVFSLLFVDVDHFKRYNDRNGHLAGDTVLGRIGEILLHSVRESDVVARYGGEEFVVLLPETPIGDAEDAAERIREAVAANPFPGEGVTVSIGISTRTPEKSRNAVEMIRAADEALYAAKQGGRNTIRSIV
jgi:diguanylate cyclase (GGDEF)-like protein